MQPIPLLPVQPPFPSFADTPIGRGLFDEPRLEQWNIHGAEDEACLQYDGTVWEEGTGPVPVDDTHPNCRCTRDPFIA